MNQKRLEITIRATLVGLLAAQGVNLPVLTAFQPTKQGRVDDGIYFFAIDVGKAGWVHRKYTNQPTGLMGVQTQINEPMYQFQAFVTDNINDDDQLLANDVLELVRNLLQSLPFIEAMQKAGIGVQRPSNIVSPMFVNERDQYEQNPNFTIVFTHRVQVQLHTPAVTKFTINQHQI